MFQMCKNKNGNFILFIFTLCYCIFECEKWTEQVYENWEALPLWIFPLLLMSFALTLTPLNRSTHESSSQCCWLSWLLVWRLVLACTFKWLTAFALSFHVTRTMTRTGSLGVQQSGSRQPSKWWMCWIISALSKKTSTEKADVLHLAAITQWFCP